VCIRLRSLDSLGKRLNALNVVMVMEEEGYGGRGLWRKRVMEEEGYGGRGLWRKSRGGEYEIGVAVLL